MSAQTINFTPELYAYYQRLGFHELPLLKTLREETHKLGNIYAQQISPEQGQFMALLVELLGAKKTLDIGTFTGYSALVVALALPLDGKVIACDVNTEWTSIAKKFWQAGNVANKIDLRIGPATDTLQQLINAGEAGSFDFAFIDADKSGYDNYYEKSLILLRSGGLIAIDNVLWGGDVADLSVNDGSTKAIRALNEKIFKDDRVKISMIPIGDGLTLARKK